jgi:hypothetical protein
MNTPSDNHGSTSDASASSSAGGNNPLWLMVGAGALFFAIAAGLLASG